MGAGGEEPQSAAASSTSEDDKAPVARLPPSSPLVPKTVYLIRHAESEENRQLASVKRCVEQLRKFSLPCKDDVVSSLRLLNVYANVDSDVSNVGKQQIQQLQRQLENDKFLFTTKVKLVVHSPLQRARQTCRQGVLGCDSTTDPNTSMLVAPTSTSVQRVEELQLLAEKKPQEWLPGNYKSFANRIAAFEQWLGEQPEDVIAIVGHQQFFQDMLGLSFRFGNCDVWEVQFVGGITHAEEVSSDAITSGADDGSYYESCTDETLILSPGWRGLKRLYTCNDDEESAASSEKKES